MQYLLVRNAQFEVSWKDYGIKFLTAGEIVCESALEAVCDLLVPRPMMLQRCRRHFLLIEWQHTTERVQKGIALANECLVRPELCELAGLNLLECEWIDSPDATLEYGRAYLKRHARPPTTLEEWLDRCTVDELHAGELQLRVAQECALKSPESPSDRWEVEQRRESLRRLEAKSRADALKDKLADCMSWEFDTSPIALELGDDESLYGETYTVFVKLACAREMFAEVRERYSRWRQRTGGVGRERFALFAYEWGIATRLIALPGRGWSPKLAGRMAARLDRKVNALVKLSPEEDEWVREQLLK